MPVFTKTLIVLALISILLCVLATLAGLFGFTLLSTILGGVGAAIYFPTLIVATVTAIVVLLRKE